MSAVARKRDEATADLSHDGIAAMRLDGVSYLVDTNDWALRAGDRAVVMHHDGTLAAATLADCFVGRPAWMHYRKDRLGLVQAATPNLGRIESRNYVHIIGRIVDQA